MINITLEQGKKLCNLARNYIEAFFTGKKVKIPEDLRSILAYPKGVFVTLYNKNTHSLRGCIGYPIARYSLGRSLKDAALGAAFQDSRFSSLKREETRDIVVEVSILNELQKIKGTTSEEIKKEIQLGRDGLVIENPFGAGLLLPQVAIEYGWKVEEFLKNLCRKAELSDDAWMDNNSKLYKFQSVVFKEQN